MSQILETLFAGGKEVTFFCLTMLLMRDPFLVPLAGYVLEEFDLLFHELGKPCGLAAYKPLHSSGEDFLHTYLGSIGIPFEPYAEYPEDATMLFLAESAAHDRALVNKIRKSLKAGATVIITSGLLKALENKGIEDLCSVKVSDRKFAANRFGIDMFISAYMNYTHETQDILLPELLAYTNDVFPLAAGFKGEKSVPLILEDSIYNGKLIILAIPENMSDLFRLPVNLLNRIRETLALPGDIYLKNVSQVRLFLYDNDRLIVQSGLPHNHKLTISADKSITGLTNLLTKEEIPLLKSIEVLKHKKQMKNIKEKFRNEFEVLMLPAGYHVFKITRK
jgi:hypothetical protein